MPPPKPPEDNIVASGFPDDIRDIGDRIAALSSDQASKLSQYLDGKQ